MDTEVKVPQYNLSEDEEKKEIVRQYRALLRSLKPKLKHGDRELVRGLHLRWLQMLIKPCGAKAVSLIYYIR